MKKIIALLLALVMLLPLAACAEGAFSYTAQSYADSLLEVYTGSILSDENGCITVDVTDGLPVMVSYDANGMCTGISTELNMKLSDADGDGGVKFGLSGIAVLLISLLQENSDDMEILLLYTQEAMDGFDKLQDTTLTDNEELLESGHTASTMIICGHPCTLTAGINTDSKSISVKLEYLP